MNATSTPGEALISVCIPAYKAERYLAETLQSIKAQTHTNWEVIVTEDGSKDRAQAIVEKFASEVAQSVRYTRHDPNRGLSATRNAGFAHARGDFIALLDADDLWLPDHLSKSLAIIQQGKDLSFSACINFDSDTGAELETRALEPSAIEAFPLSLHEGKLVIQPSTVVFKRSILAQGAAFNTAYPICNDLEFWFQLARKGLLFGATGEVTCRYRKHPTALSRNSAALIAEVASLHRLYRDWPGLPTRRRARLSLRAHNYAARMVFKNKPLDAARLLLTGLYDFLLPRR